jgi:hypothetical protein
MPNDVTKTMGQAEAHQVSEAWHATSTALLNGHQQVLTQLLQTMQGISSELSQLAQMRLQLMLEAWSAMAACRNPEEVIDCGRRMTGRMIDHCSGEIVKLSQITMRMQLVQPADCVARRVL